MFGAGFFDHLAAHPELGGRFQEMMAHLNRVTNAVVPEAYDFSGFGTIVDVGGGNGSLLASVLAANRSARGVLFDQPHVLDQARQQLADAGVADRCDLAGGDFFAGVPEGSDAYLLRWILHDFDDERAVRILRSCRTAMPAAGRLLVIEQVVAGAGDRGDWMTNFLDLQMLILLGGQGAHRGRVPRALRGAGFELRRVVATRSPFSILEGVPA